MMVGCAPEEMGMLNIYRVPGFRGTCKVDPKELTKYLVSQATEGNRVTQDPNDVKYQDFELDVANGPEILKEAVEDIMLQFGFSCGYKVGLVNAWTICHEREHQTYPHNHIDEENNYACVYWAQVPEGSGDLEFYPLGMPGEPIIVKPIAGQFMIFPGSVLHGVRQNLSDELRVSMSLNLIMNIRQPLTEGQKEFARDRLGIDEDIEK